MCNDFYDKYDEYMNVVAERKDRTMRQTNYSLANVEAGHMADFVEKAVSFLTICYRIIPALTKEHPKSKDALGDSQVMIIV